MAYWNQKLHRHLHLKKYLELLDKMGYEGAVLLHSLVEEQVPGCKEFLESKMP